MANSNYPRLNNQYELGIYSLGVQISEYLLVAGTSLFLAFEPDVFNNTINKNTRGLKKNFIQYAIVII